MTELLQRFTSLPNLHPALVHFPIALLPVAALLDLLALAFRKQREWLDRAAVALYVAAALGAGAAYWAGEEAVESLALLVPAIERHVHEHEDSAWLSLWLMVALAVVRLGVAFADRKGARRLLRAGLLLAALAVTAHLYRTADLGGGLVYRHGVGVAAAVATDEAQPPAGPAAELEDAGAPRAAGGLLEGADGSLEWRPAPGDREALDTVLRPAPGSEASAAAWAAPRPGAEGLALRIDGSALLLLPGTFGDVRVEVVLDLGEFSGEAGVAHHARGATAAGFLTASVPGNEIVLGTLDGEDTRTLDRATRPLPKGPFRLTVSALGSHLKGHVEDALAVHGHEPALPEGGCGLVVRGRGTVRVVSLKITPIAD